MYTFGVTASRCSLCYALLHTNSTSVTIGYSSSNRRHGYRCSTAAIERIISSSRIFQKLWHKNDNRMYNNRSICFRCCDTIRQIEQIKNHIEQLHDEQNILMNKLEHNLFKRALVIQGRKLKSNDFIPISFNPKEIPINEDDDTEEGEEKPQNMSITNGHKLSSPTRITTMTTTTALVGAQRRKSKVAHKISLEDKASLLNHTTRQSNSPISRPTENISPKPLVNSQLAKLNRTNLIPDGLNGHNSGLAGLSLSSAYKSLMLPTASTAGTTPPFIDPTTGALIAIVSNPHHAALLAQQHQQLFKSSSISPTSTNTMDEREIMHPKQPSQKKFPCLLCGRDFSNKSNLNRHHSIVHVAIRNFECARCPKKFKLRQGLKTHMQRCHGVNTDEPTFVLQKHHVHHHH